MQQDIAFGGRYESSHKTNDQTTAEALHDDGFRVRGFGAWGLGFSSGMPVMALDRKTPVRV